MENEFDRTEGFGGVEENGGRPERRGYRKSESGKRDFQGRRPGRGDRRFRKDDMEGTEQTSAGREERKEDILFGMHPVLEALKAGKKIDKIFFKRGMEGDLYRELIDLVTENNIPFQFVPVEKLNKFTTAAHQGVVAVIPKVDYVEFADVLPRALEKSSSPVFLMLDGVTDVRNFGAIVRTAECCGVSAVLVPAKGAAAINGDAIKTSAGALLRVDTCKVPTLKKAIAELKEAGFKVVAATEKCDSSIYDEDFTGPVAIVMGSESKGISEGVLEMCDAQVRIPMVGNIGSLNVSVATAVVLYELVRQRTVNAE